ncbi:MAG: hypothetical protein ACQERS_11250 [Bacteroidota bacterium]
MEKRRKYDREFKQMIREGVVMASDSGRFIIVSNKMELTIITSLLTSGQ